MAHVRSRFFIAYPSVKTFLVSGLWVSGSWLLVCGSWFETNRKPKTRDQKLETVGLIVFGRGSWFSVEVSFVNFYRARQVPLVHHHGASYKRGAKDANLAGPDKCSNPVSLEQLEDHFSLGAVPERPQRHELVMALVVDSVLRGQFRNELDVAIRANANFRFILGFAVGTECHCSY